jgi:hypothetical protein
VKTSQISLIEYFSGTSTEFCTTEPRTGLIERIIFADDPNVDFAQVKSFAQRATATENVQDFASDPATGNIQEIQLPQSSAPKPDSSNGTNGVRTILQR